MNDRTTRRMFALLKDAKVTNREDRLDLYRWLTWRGQVESTDDLTSGEIEGMVHTMASWQKAGELESQCRSAIDDWRRGDKPVEDDEVG